MKHMFVIIGFTYLFCIFVSNAFNYVISVFLSGLFLIMAIALGFLMLKYKFKMKKLLIVSITAVIAFASYGINYHLNIEPIQILKGQDIEIKAQLTEAVYKNYGKYYYILDADILSDNKDTFNGIKFRASSTQFLPIKINGNIKCKVHVSENNTQDNSLFNSEDYLRSQGIYLSGYIYEYEPYFINNSDESTIFQYPSLFREYLTNELTDLVPQDYSSILCAVLLGNKSLLDEDILDDFRTTGIAHIICVSGLHLSIIAGFIFFMLGIFGLNRKISSIITAVFIMVFVVFTGMSASIIRAGIMSVIYYICHAQTRKPDSLNSLGIAVSVMCVLNPFSSENISLLLSSFSTFGIITLYPKISDYVFENFTFLYIKPLKFITESVMITISATLPTLPIMILVFGEISVIGIISNLLIIFPCTVMLIAIFLFLCIYLFVGLNFITYPFLYVATLGAKYIRFCISSLADLQFASIRLPQNIIIPCLFSILILFAVVYVVNNVEKYLRIFMLLSVIIIIFGVISYDIASFNTVKLTVFSSSVGCSVILTKEDKTAILCCGGNSFTERKIEKFLKTRSTKNPEMILLPYIDKQVSYCAGDIINRFNPEAIFFNNESELDDKINRCLKDRNNIFSYNRNLKLKLWNNVEINSVSTSKSPYISVKIDAIKILIVPMGDEIPKALSESYDFIVVGVLPKNMQDINSEYCIASMDEEDAKKNFHRFQDIAQKLILTCVNGDITLEFNEGNSVYFDNEQY